MATRTTRTAEMMPYLEFLKNLPDKVKHYQFCYKLQWIK